MHVLYTFGIVTYTNEYISHERVVDGFGSDKPVDFNFEQTVKRV